MTLVKAVLCVEHFLLKPDCVGCPGLGCTGGGQERCLLTHLLTKELREGKKLKINKRKREIMYRDL